MQHQRPKPPAKRASSTRGAQVKAAASQRPSTSEEEPGLKAATLHAKLSESNLSMSKPPDSPPISSYDYPVGFASGQGAEQGSHGRVEDGSVVASPQTSKDSGASSSRITAQAPELPLEGALPFPPTSTSAPSDDSLVRGPSFSPEKPNSIVNARPGVSNEVLSDVASLAHKSPEELMRLIVEHEQKLREQQQQIAQLTLDGTGLTRKHDTIRARHSSLLSQSSTSSLLPSSSSKHSRLSSASSASAELRERPPPSPAQGHRAWRASLGGGSSNAPSPATSSRGQRETSIESDLSGTSHIIPPSPSTPSRRGHAPRSSTASAASVSSLFAASPRVGSGSNVTKDIQKLNQENYSLRSELFELTEEQQEREREWKRVLRKVERDTQSLAKELQRVGERNAALEEELGLGAATLRASVSGRWQDEAAEESTPRTKLLHHRRRNSASSLTSDADDTFPAVGDFAPPTVPPFEAPRAEPDTPINVAAARYRRSPGNGTPRPLVDSPTPGAGPSTPSTDDRPPKLALRFDQDQERLRDQEQHDNVQRLLDTIDELRQTKEEIEEERIMMAERLEQASREVEMFRMRCEELEEAQVDGIAWEDRKGIEWHSPSSPCTSPDSRRRKGNRRDIERAQRRYSREGSRPFSVSDRSINSASSTRSVSPSPGGGRRGQGRLDESRVRTLGSELGRHWADESFEEQLSHGGEEADIDEEDEEGSKTTGSTSTPAKHRYRPHRPRDSTISLSPTSSRPAHDQRRPFVDYDLDTTEDLFPPGSLRHTGPPDSETFEALSRVANELPAVWEDEDDFALGVAAGSPMKGWSGQDKSSGKGKEKESRRRSRGVHSGRVSDGVIRGLEWKEPPSRGEREYYGQCDESKEGGEGFKAIESGEMVDARGRGLRKRTTRQGTGLGLHLLDDSDYSDREGTALTRRQLALRRLGLDSPASSSATLLPSDRPPRQHYHYHRFHHSRSSSRSSYTSSSFSSHSSGSDPDSDADPPSSEFSHLSSSARLVRRGNTYYPLTLRARYAPQMLVNRFKDNAFQTVLDLAAYLRFFAVLGMALAFAIWQGPRKTMGSHPRRRIR